MWPYINQPDTAAGTCTPLTLHIGQWAVCSAYWRGEHQSSRTLAIVSNTRPVSQHSTQTSELAATIANEYHSGNRISRPGDNKLRVRRALRPSNILPLFLRAPTCCCRKPTHHKKVETIKPPPFCLSTRRVLAAVASFNETVKLVVGRKSHNGFNP